MQIAQRFIGCCFYIWLLIVAGSLTAAQAQTTIFNVPSTDVITERTAYLEADFISHLDSYRKGGFQTYGYRVVYGAKRRFEVGANFFYTRNGSTSPKEFQPNAKWKVYGSEKYGVGVSTGAIVFVPLNKSAGRRTYGLVYGNASKTIKSTKGTRLTGGAYTLVGARRRDVGTKTGAIVGFEQPLTRRVSLVADWFSGRNRFGYFTPGFSVAITKRQFLFAGYSFSNISGANNALSVYYGVTF